MSTWIPAHDSIRDHPKRRRLSRRLAIDEHAAIGLLLCFWWWCMEYAPDGDISEFEPEDIADGIGWAGEADRLLAALAECGFLDDAVVHDWSEYGGKLQGRKEWNAQRMRDARAAHVQRTCTKSAEPEKSREEKSREERSKPSKTTSQNDVISSSEFDIFWQEYPKKVGKGDARKSYALARKKADADAILAGLRLHLPGWQSTEARFIPNPATWLNQERWSDTPVTESTPNGGRPINRALIGGLADIYDGPGAR